MVTNNIEEMIELSFRKRNILIEILDLTKRQKSYINEDNMDEVNIILQKKEELMKKIDIYDKEFIHNYQIVKNQEGIDSMDMIDIRKYGNLKSLKSIVNEINTILNQITMIDQENMINMQSSIIKIKSDLKQVKEVKRAYKGYNYESGESILIDKKKQKDILSIFLSRTYSYIIHRSNLNNNSYAQTYTHYPQG